MLRDHEYKLQILWTGNRGSGTMDYRSYDRDFTVSSKDKPTLSGSSGSVFNGDKTAYCPEDLLVAAVSSCHMLWYLHLCADNEIVVIDYKDDAYGLMHEENDGSGYFTKIVLNPEISISRKSNIEKAKALHTEAHKMCFIANSLKCPIHFEPTFKIG